MHATVIWLLFFRPELSIPETGVEIEVLATYGQFSIQRKVCENEDRGAKRNGHFAYGGKVRTK